MMVTWQSNKTSSAQPNPTTATPMATPSMTHMNTADFLLENPYLPFNPSPPALTPLQSTSPPPLPNGSSSSSGPVAHLRAEWEARYSQQELPPPPPGYFATREEMIDTAKQWADEHGYTLVIGHSAKHAGEPSRCWLTCDLAGVYRNRHHLTPDVRKRKRESRKLDCPMKVLGTKRRYEEGWTLHLPDPAKAVHNHGPIVREDSPPPPPEYPELEQALFQWQQQMESEGAAIHGNTLKAKAFELFKSLGIQRNGRPLPNFANGWLKDYRRRQGLSVRTTKPAISNVPVNPLQFATMEFSLPVPAEGQDLFRSVNSFVKEYMSKFDASHDYNHILRVLSLSNRIYSAEMASNPDTNCDPMAVFLAALLHDVGDKKYADPNQDVENQVAEILFERGASDALALKVQMIVKNVSYSTEIRNPRLTKAVISQHPELAIVQDADRLDAIGAVGIGRTFTFGGAKGRVGGMEDTIKHFDDKLLKLEDMMKTDKGKELARERTQRLQLFKLWWQEETGVIV